MIFLSFKLYITQYFVYSIYAKPIFNQHQLNIIYRVYNTKITVYVT